MNTSPSIVFDDPDALKDREQLHVQHEIERDLQSRLEQRKEQARSLYPKLRSGTATSREVQGALALALRLLAVALDEDDGSQSG